jgi:hypothetical protein
MNSLGVLNFVVAKALREGAITNCSLYGPGRKTQRIKNLAGLSAVVHRPCVRAVHSCGFRARETKRHSDDEDRTQEARSACAPAAAAVASCGSRLLQH